MPYNVPAKKIGERLADYVMSNLIASITAFGMFVGGLIVLIYLGSENYFPPDMNTATFGVLLGAIALIGIFLTIFLSLYFVLPGYIYRHVLAAELKQYSIDPLGQVAIIVLLDIPAIVVAIVFTTLIFIEQDWSGLGWGVAASVIYVWIRSSTSKYKFDSHICLASLLVGISLLGAGLLCADKLKVVWPYLLFSSLLPILFASIAYLDLDKQPKNLRNESDEKWANINNLTWSLLCYQFRWKVEHFIVAISILISVIPWLFILLFAIGYSRGVKDDLSVLQVIFAMSFLVIVANHVIVSAKKWWVLLIGAGALLFFIILVSQQWSLIPRIAVRALSIGDVRKATLQLDEQGCQIALKYAALERAGQEGKSELEIKWKKELENKGATNALYTAIQNAKPAICTLSGTTITWRIGNEYAINASNEADKLNNSISELKFKIEVPKYKVIVDKCAKQKDSCGNSFKRYFEPLDLTYTFNSKFTIPSGHVLSWSVAEAQATSGVSASAVSAPSSK